MVTKVDPQGPAGRAGLEPGDIIYQINNQAIRGLNDYDRILEQIQPGQEALLLVRDGRTGEIGILTDGGPMNEEENQKEAPSPPSIRSLPVRRTWLSREVRAQSRSSILSKSI